MLAAARGPYASGSQRELMPLLALCALGLVIVLFVASGPWIVDTYGYGVFVPGIMLSGLATLAATTLVCEIPIRNGLIVVVTVAVAARILALSEAPLLSTDIYRYIWDGRVQAAGINPYAYVPADQALSALRDTEIYPNINRADYAVTAYPPVAQMFFFVVTRISETVTAMRMAMVSCEIVIVAVMIDLLRRLELPATAVVGWAWHPLPIWEIANNGHVDALMVALFMLGVWLLVRNRALFGAVAMALAAMVKPYIALVLPAFWRPWDWRVPAAIMATVAVCYLPYLGAGSGVLGFLTAGYLGEEGLSSGEGFWAVALIRTFIGGVPGLAAGYALIALGVLAYLAVRMAWRTHTTAQSLLQDVAVLLAAGLFFVSPNYPWYVLAAVPFVVLGGGAPLWAMTLAAFLLYRPAMLPDNDLAWKTLATLPFLAAVAACMLRRRTFARVEKVSP